MSLKKFIYCKYQIIVILLDQKNNIVILDKGIPNDKSDDYTYGKPYKFKG